MIVCLFNRNTINSKGRNKKYFSVSQDGEKNKILAKDTQKKRKKHEKQYEHEKGHFRG